MQLTTLKRIAYLAFIGFALAAGMWLRQHFAGVY